jgi:hypothetical protein
MRVLRRRLPKRNLDDGIEARKGNRHLVMRGGIIIGQDLQDF